MSMEHTMPERMVKLEMEVKELRARAPDIEQRLRKIERNMYIGCGAVMVLQLLLKFMH